MIEACENACLKGHREIVNYLYTDVGVTEKVFLNSSMMIYDLI
jgi:hypothetical protein